MKNFISVAAVLILLGTSSAIASEIIDLTHTFNKKTIYWPTARPFHLEKIFWGYTTKGYYYSVNAFSAPEHGGTHLDAPIHFAKARWTVEKIPVKRFVGKAVVIDVKEKAQKNTDYLIRKEDITAWEERERLIGPDDIVLFNTGWARYWGNKKKYLGTDIFGDTLNMHFPGISVEAAKYLVSKRVKGVGLDTPSLDNGPSQHFKAHRILLGANIYGLENVANINRLPARGATLYVAPMKIAKGTGAPTRILAIID